MSAKRPAPLMAIFLLTVVSPAMASAGGPAVEFRFDPPTGERLLTLEIPAPSWSDLEGRVVPSLPGFGRLGLAGAPDLPARVERIALPPGGTLRVAGVEVSWSEGLLPGPIAAFPARDPAAAAIDPTIAARAGWWPAEPVRIAVADGAWRTLRFAALEIAPLQVDLAAGRFRVATRLVIRMEVDVEAGAAASAVRAAPTGTTGAAERAFAHGAAEVPRLDLSSALEMSGPAPLGPLDVPSYPGWQFVVTEDGLYRITYEWAQANAPGLLSFLAANDPRRYRLRVQGIEVPIRVAGEADGAFGPGDAIVFHGQAIGRIDLFEPDAWQKGDFTDANVYRLDTTTAPLRIAASAFTGPPNGLYAVPPSFRHTVRHEEDEKFNGFVPADGVDHWYVDPFLDANGVPVSLDQLVATPDHAGGSIDLRVRLLGFQYNRNFHRSEISLDGTARDTKDWDGYREFTHGVDGGPVSFPATLGATSTIRVRLPLGRTADSQPVTRDTVAVNWIEIDYDRLYRGLSDRLLFSAPNAQREVRLSAFGSPPEVWEVSDGAVSAAGMTIAIPRAVTALGPAAGGWGFTLESDAGRPATRRFVAASGAGYRTPAAVREDLPPSALDPSLGASLKDAGLGADWVVVGARPLLDMTAGSRLRDLVAHRESQECAAGRLCEAAVIDIQDVYDEFSDGIEDTRALRQFVAHTLGNWSPAPQFLLLVGDATRDYRNFFGYTPVRQLVPTQMFDLTTNTQFGYYPSDTWFGAVVGTDDVPDLAVGRIPAHSLAEAEEVFRKTLAYETGPQPASWAGRACLVSEMEAGAPETFTAIHDSMYAQYFSSGPAVAQKVYELAVDEDCQGGGTPMNNRVDACHDVGAALLTYVGHGSYKGWGKSCSIFQTASPTDPPGTREDLLDLSAGSPLSFQVHANCITGHFPADSSLGSTNDLWYTFLEDWLTTADKGIVGGFAPAHLTYLAEIDSVMAPFYDEIFGRKKERLVGNIDARLRASFQAFNNTVGIRSFVLEGDPALRLAVPAPDAPAITSITNAGTRALSVAWTPAAGAAFYRLYRATVPGGSYTLAQQTAATSALDGGLTNCREYFYYVVAVDADGFESRWSNFNDTCYGDRSDCRSGIPENPSGPLAPTLTEVRDTQAGGELQVSWIPPADPGGEIVGYRVTWSETPGGPALGEQTTGAAATTAAIGGLTNGATYWVRVRAENCSLPGPYSGELSGVPHLVRGLNPPQAIGDLRVVRQGVDLRLNWTPPSLTVWGIETSLSAIEVYGSTNGPAFPLTPANRLASLGPGASQWTHAGQGSASPNPRWYYSVVAVDSTGLRSAGGDELPDGIADLRVARAAAGSEVRLTWPAVTGTIDGRPLEIAGYNLYGRPSTLPRAACGDANRLVADIPPAAGTVEATLTMPAGAYYTWQVLAEDWHGGEAVW